MNADELAKGLSQNQIYGDDYGLFNRRIQNMLRQQQAEIAELEIGLKNVWNVVEKKQAEIEALKVSKQTVKELTDEEIMEIFTAYEQMQEYGYVGKKPFKVHTGWNLSERNDCLMLARAILRKAQEK